jgi:hypothetical protein
VQEAAGSNPVVPTKDQQSLHFNEGFVVSERLLEIDGTLANNDAEAVGMSKKYSGRRVNLF